jgi:hypothetical protein
MSTFNLTNSADVIVSPVAWQTQVKDQSEVDHLTALLATATARLGTTKTSVRDVLSQAITRASGTLPGGEQITDVVTNEDASVTITSA